MTNSTLHIPADNGPYAEAPDATLALAHARKLRGLSMGLCLSPDNADGWVAHTGKSGRLIVLQIEGDPSPSLGLPPLPATWEVTLPGTKVRGLWFTPPWAADGELLIGMHKPTACTVLRAAPLPGSVAQTGERYEWHSDLNPWTIPAPTILPLRWWRALPVKQKKIYSSRPTISLFRKQYK